LSLQMHEAELTQSVVEPEARGRVWNRTIASRRAYECGHSAFLGNGLQRERMRFEMKRRLVSSSAPSPQSALSGFD